MEREKIPCAVVYDRVDRVLKHIPHILGEAEMLFGEIARDAFYARSPGVRPGGVSGACLDHAVEGSGSGFGTNKGN